MSAERYVSGIQSSGDLHLGNYYGALADQRDRADDDAWFFVADLHALAAGRDPAGVESSTVRAAATCLAVGLGDGAARLFRQSDVAEILQMQWLLGTVVRLEDLEVDEDVRARRERNAIVSASRAGYSVLMAADILGLRATHAIVGADQEQHVLMIRQYARALNRRCERPAVHEEIHRFPDPPRPVLLGRGGVKMSKSVGNGLSLRADREAIIAYIAALHPGDDLPIRPEDCVLVNLLRHLEPDSADTIVGDYDALRHHGARIDAIRDDLVERVDALVGQWRERHAFYDTPEGKQEIEERLAEGAEAARLVVSDTVATIRGALRTPSPTGRGRPTTRAADAVGPKPLTYSEYVNVPALIDSLAPPAATPVGVDPAAWPWSGFATSVAALGGSAPPDADGRESWRLPRLPTDHPHWAHDEVLFITVHQAFELWFRHALFELDDMMDRVHAVFAARNIAELAGRSPIPHSLLMRRHPERAARMHFAHTLRGHRRLAALVRRIEDDAAGHPELADYAEWIRETPRPGVFPDDVDLPPLKLEWFAPEFPTWTSRLDRVAHIVETACAFYDILRRMPPTSFLEFRSRLDPSSGFGSGQFRQLEIFTGQRERHFSSFGTLGRDGDVVDQALWDLVVEHVGDAGEAGDLAARAVPVLESALPPDEFQRVRARMLEPTLRDLADMLLLAGAGEAAHRRDLADRIAAANYTELYETGKRRRTHGFAHTQREREMWRTVGAQLSHMESIAATAVLGDDPAFAAGDLDDAGRREFKRFLEACLNLDRAIMTWRVAHLSFVESMIGARPGTGGGGLVYLQETMKATRADYVLRSFPPVWAARSLVA